MRREQGQSTLEYLVLVLLAVAVLAAGAAAAGHAGIAHAVAARIAAALCGLGPGACPAPGREPCVTASELRRRDVALRLAVVRLGGGRTVLRERRSDGSEVVTVISGARAGLGVQGGAEVRLGGRRLGGMAEAAVEGRLLRGRSWRVAGPREAQALLRRLDRGIPSAGRTDALRLRRVRPPAPDVVLGERGMDSAARVRLGRVGLGLDAEDLLGSRTDRRTGERTFTIRRRNELTGSLGLAGGVGGEGAARRDERYELVVDGAGRPLRILVGQTRRVHAGVALPGPLRTLLGAAGPPLRRGRLVQVERSLDLGDPQNLAAAAAFVRALRTPRLRLADAVAVSAALRARLDAAGTGQARVYALDVRHTGAGASAGALAGLGGETEGATETLRLVAAAEQGAGGAWRPREDCGVPLASVRA